MFPVSFSIVFLSISKGSRHKYIWCLESVQDNSGLHLNSASFESEWLNRSCQVQDGFDFYELSIIFFFQISFISMMHKLIFNTIDLIGGNDQWNFRATNWITVLGWFHNKKNCALWTQKIWIFVCFKTIWTFQTTEKIMF